MSVTVMKTFRSIRLFYIAIVIVLVSALTACSSNYVVDANFPRPLVEPLPVSGELVITEEFQNYVFVEDTETRDDLEVDISSAQVELFQTITEHIFGGSEAPEDQLIITPALVDFQYAIPRETRAEVYEIWLKYRVQVMSSNGEAIADWLITGYGKTPTAFMKTRQDSIELATTIALRDVGSQLSIGFSRQPDIRAWLDRREEQI
ncbi:MAG: hypothetical protein RLN82_05930 [Pseudomonadales bacterium]